jgi:hypothetical protein
MSALDHWIVGKSDDGRYIVRTENDGWAYLRNGAQAHDALLTREELDQQYPGLYARYAKRYPRPG